MSCIEKIEPLKVDLKTELALQIRGEIVSSNLPAYAAEIKSFIQALPTELETEDDFKAAKQNIKALANVEAAVKLAKEQALKQAKEVYDTLSELDSIGETGKNTRLNLSRLIKTEDARVRQEAEDAAVALIEVDSREEYRPRIAKAMKSKRTPETRKKAANDEAVSINKHNKESDLIIADFVNKNGASIAPDTSNLREMDHAALRDQLTRRAELAEAEKERKQLQAEAEKERKRLEAEYEKDRKYEHGKIKPVDSYDTLARNPLPDPPKIGSIPTSRPATLKAPDPTVDPTRDETEVEEAFRFIVFAESCFISFRQTRLNLKHSNNIKASKVLAKSMCEAWKTFKNKIS